MNDSAIAAIKYALEKCDDVFDSMWFLRLWNEGDFEAIREEYEDVPDEVFIDADPLFKFPAHIEDGEEVKVVAWQHRVIAGQKMGCSGWNPGKGEEFESSYTVERRPLMTVAQHQRIVAARSCPCQTDTARETRRKDGIEAAELQGILMRDHEACRPRDAGLMGWAAAALSAPPASEQQQTVQQPHTVEFVGKTCQRVLMAEGKPYPRTCAACDLFGPCKSFPRENDR